MKAKELEVGMRVVSEAGDDLRITQINHAGIGTMSMEGHPNRRGIDLFFSNGESTTIHPEREVFVRGKEVAK